MGIKHARKVNKCKSFECCSPQRSIS